MDQSFLPKVASSLNRLQDIVLLTFVPNPSNDREKAFYCLHVHRSLFAYLAATSSFKKSDLLSVLVSGPCNGKQASKASLDRLDSTLEPYSLAGVSPPSPI